MKHEYHFHPKLIVRTPNLSISSFLGQEFDLDILVNNPVFIEAVFIATPVLYEEVVKYKAGKMTEQKDISKLMISLFKYYSRMSTRCTPFGLFSGCAVADWSAQPTQLQLGIKKERHTRIDMLFLCSLGNYIGSLPFIKERLIFFTNNTMYSIGAENRYIEYKAGKGRRRYMISSFQKNDVLNAIVEYAMQGVSYDEVRTYVEQLAEVSAEAARAFIDELIDSQILVSNIDPVITGAEMMDRMLRILQGINQPEHKQITQFITILQMLSEKLMAIDSGTSTGINSYKEVEALISQLKIPYDATKLFQVDSFSVLKNRKLSDALQLEIMEGLDLLNHFNKVSQCAQLEKFIAKFQERYGEQEVPLLEVMDNETGIMYGDGSSVAVTPLLEGVSLARKNPTDFNVRWSLTDSYLMDSVMEAARNGRNYVDLADQAGPKNLAGWSKLPPSFGFTFKLLENGGVMIDNVGGSSAINMMGRFAHGNDEVNGIINDLVAIEEMHNNEVIMAEVVFLPESRTGNVLQHPSFRKFEIPFLTHSNVTGDHQIFLRDIVVRVHQQKIILFSKKYNKEIVPRISTAHNWHESSSLPIYRFLGDLQLQGLQQGIFFNWGNIESQHKYLPRVTYKNIVFKQAQWKLGSMDIKGLLSGSESFSERIAAFRKEWDMPRYVVLADGDNELFIDFENPKVDYWLSVFKKRSRVFLKEFLLPATLDGVMDENGRVYNHQIMAFLYKNKSTYEIRNSQASLTKDMNLAHRFAIGSEWLYFKIYCGVKSADMILFDGVRSAMEEMRAKRLIKTFFFIRYLDPDFHLRVRFQLADIAFIGEAIQVFKKYIKLYEEYGYVNKLQVDTYERELTRYGLQTMELSEQLFDVDSISILDFLNKTEGDRREELRWLWGIRSIDQLLSDFGLDVTSKMHLLSGLKTAFHDEFGTDKIVRDDLNNKYRKYRKSFEQILSGGIEESEIPTELNEIVVKRSSEVSRIAASIREKAGDNSDQLLIHLLPSYLHMHINRLVMAKSKFHELVIYDFLFSYYQSVIKRDKSQQKQINENKKTKELS